MAANGKPSPSTNYPLWIIAISLLIIAICLVVDLFTSANLDRRPVSILAPQAEAEPEPVPAQDRPGVRVATRPRHVTPAEALPTDDFGPANSPSEIPAAPLATVPAPHSAVAGSQPVGYSVSGISQTNRLGEIFGRITLNGTPPAETRITVNTEPVCGRRTEPLMTRRFVVSEDKGLADAVVFVKRGTDSSHIRPSTNIATILFTNCEVEPYVSAIQARQPVDFRDRDGVMHTLRLGDGDAARTFMVPANAGQQFRNFTSPRLFVPVRCLRHTWETAFICVVENPFFAVTDGNGNFDIPNIPPGTYTIEVAHQRATGTNGVTRSVIVVAGKTAELDLALDVPKNGPLSTRMTGNVNP